MAQYLSFEMFARCILKYCTLKKHKCLARKLSATLSSFNRFMFCPHVWFQHCEGAELHSVCAVLARGKPYIRYVTVTFTKLVVATVLDYWHKSFTSYMHTRAHQRIHICNEAWWNRTRIICILSMLRMFTRRTCRMCEGMWNMHIMLYTYIWICG